MKTWYTRTLSASSFCIGPEVPLPVDDYRYRILLSSPGGALLPCRREDFNGEVSLHYDISGYLPFSDLVRPYSLRFSQLLSFTELLLTVLGTLPDSLLTAGDVLLDTRYLFVNVSLTRLKLVLYPWERSKEEDDPPAPLFLSLFRLADPEDDDAALLLFRLYCAASDGGGLPRLLSILYTAAGRQESRDASRKDTPPVQPAAQAGSRPAALSPQQDAPPSSSPAFPRALPGAWSGLLSSPAPEPRTDKKEALRLLPAIVPAGLALCVLTFAALHRLSGITLPLAGLLTAGLMLLSASALLLFLLQKKRKDRREAAAGAVQSAVTVSSSGEPHKAAASDVPSEHRADAEEGTDDTPAVTLSGTETTILTKNGTQAACLRAENAVMAPVILPPGEHRIGKNAELADVVLSQSGVSRLHAELACRDGGWYLKDLGSRNGTMLNGELLPPNTPVLLSDRDRLTFGSLEFTFLRTPAG